ncbi:MAG: phytoene desaturase family protein [Anaerolineae bacterium]
MSPPILVVGAGIGGLSAAVHLAAAGHDVLIVEQNETVGGKMGSYRADGFRWDTGPSVITMRGALEQVFLTVGRDMEDYLSLMPVEPITRYLYPDGTVLDATRDLPRMAEQIERLNPRDVEGYLSFLSHAAALNRITGPVFIQGNPPSPRDLLRVPLRDMVKVDAWRTMDRAIRHWVKDQHIRHLLRRYATYVGASPYRAPAVLNVIAHTELTGGVWYPRAGIYAIAQAFRRLAEELGVEIQVNRQVSEILVDDAGAVEGVKLRSGSMLKAPVVVANVDVTTTHSQLLPRDIAAGRLRRLKRIEPSLSGFVLLLGLRDRTPALVQHNIIFPSDYRQEFRDIFDNHKPPSEPTIYISISARQSPEDAPAGCENWFVLVNVPPTGPEFDWATQISAYRDRVLDRIEDAGFEVRDRLVSEATITPVDLARFTGAWRGALYGPSSNQWWNALRRPHPRDRRIRGLYFAGGTTHPGGGVPMVTLSGRAAARMVLDDLKTGKLDGRT